MKKLNPIERSGHIEARYKEYLSSSFRFGMPALQRQFENELEQADLFRGPYLALDLPFRRGKSLRELVREGVVCPSFLSLGDIYPDRPLYIHQEEAIRQIGSGRGAVVTTGTGSGKTECFLYPILNELLRDLENGNRTSGIRAIFLYPMNALLNDQINRVRALLTPCPDITFGFFTGETPETVSRNYREKYFLDNNIKIPENELVSRAEIRENPPHLLFTNYSMLEYLLIRPTDYTLFEPSHLKNWKFVVLDEAHTYSGSLGIEISMLMRRLTGLAARKPRFILTSATLGQQGKSEKAIVEFAKNLTAAGFKAGDIIFSKRIPLDAAGIKYTMTAEDYLELYAHPDEIETVGRICSRYGISAGSDVPESLYDLLLADRNVHRLCAILQDGPRDTRHVLQELEKRGSSLSAESLTALIEIINQAEKDGMQLFTLKYHSFVRPLSGGYITAEASPRLTLKKTNMIGSMRAFEVGNCRYCNSLYLIGKIRRSDTDALDYLFQNREVDIYENYGSNNRVELDYFLFQNTVQKIQEEEDDEADQEGLEEYRLCGRCGCIYPAARINAKHCTCGDEWRISVYKILPAKKTKKQQDTETVWNNITRCPCCLHRSSSGVVRALNLGKDEGTALIAQMLLESLDEKDEKEASGTAAGRLSLFGKSREAATTETTAVKQFLAFSDSRQQASFFATFLDANHARMLRKRLIWNEIEKQNYRDIPANQMISRLTSVIRAENLFDNDMNSEQNAWAAVLSDLLHVDGRYDSEGMGLYWFDLDLSEILDSFTEEEIAEQLGPWHLTKQSLEALMQVVFDVFRTAPAVDSSLSGLSVQQRQDVLEYRAFDNAVTLQGAKSQQRVRSFLPIKGTENKTVRYVMKACDCSAEDAKDLLTTLFQDLAVESGLLVNQGSQSAYQIPANRYVIKNYRKHPCYCCSRCGRLTPHNVNNACVEDRCDGTLCEVDPDLVLKNNYYRNEYKTKKVERVVVKEHTAQLDNKTARTYQQDFRERRINILSCSTTFEMGVDIGDLDTVFLRNVPPTPANYVQRAGRAGRRKGTAAYVLTYCNTTSHDFTWFSEPEKMISGVINPPHFDVLNRKIITRHLMAASFGFFFREYPEYYLKIDGLAFGDGESRFRTWLAAHPADLGRYIDTKILPEKQYEAYHDFRWFDEIAPGDDRLQNFVSSMQTMKKELEEAKNQAVAAQDYDRAGSLSRQIQLLYNTKVLTALSKYCVIPKYGFPVDVVDLQIYEQGVLDQRYDLNRDLRIGISEYAPGSEVIVDKNKYTSQYITLPRTGSFIQHNFRACPVCRTNNVFHEDNAPNTCCNCGAALVDTDAETYIEPVYGFKTGLTKQSAHLKPRRSYAGEVSYLGGGISDGGPVNIRNTVLVTTTSDDVLLVMNRSVFFMCPVCGYAEKGSSRTLPMMVKEHQTYRQRACINDTLERIRLGHTFRTDVARFEIPLLSAGGDLSREAALSFLYAFLEGISLSLSIERTDIDGLLELNKTTGASYDILLFDNVPGGAGHVKRLLDKKAVKDSLEAALAKVSQNCCDEDTSCYNCLRNYYNQSVHPLLKRSLAKDVTTRLLAKL